MKFLRKIPKNSRNSNLPEDPRSQKEAGGGPPWPRRPEGAARGLAAPPGRLAKWGHPRGPPLSLIFTPDEETQKEMPCSSFLSRSHRHLCSSSGELIWRLFWPPVRGIRRHSHHHHHSIIPPCFPHPCVSNSLL